MVDTKFNILIIDDDKDLLDVLDAECKRHGINAICVSDISQIQGMTRFLVIHAVLSEIALANGNGVTLLRRLKRESRFKDSLIFFMSGVYNEDSLMENEKGNFFPKPFQLEEVVFKIKEKVYGLRKSQLEKMTDTFTEITIPYRNDSVILGKKRFSISTYANLSRPLHYVELDLVLGAFLNIDFSGKLFFENKKIKGHITFFEKSIIQVDFDEKHSGSLHQISCLEDAVLLVLFQKNLVISVKEESVNGKSNIQISKDEFNYLLENKWFSLDVYRLEKFYQEVENFGIKEVGKNKVLQLKDFFDLCKYNKQEIINSHLKICTNPYYFTSKDESSVNHNVVLQADDKVFLESVLKDSEKYIGDLKKFKNPISIFQVILGKKQFSSFEEIENFFNSFDKAYKNRDLLDEKVKCIESIYTIVQKSYEKIKKGDFQSLLNESEEFIADRVKEILSQIIAQIRVSDYDAVKNILEKVPRAFVTADIEICQIWLNIETSSTAKNLIKWKEKILNLKNSINNKALYLFVSGCYYMKSTDFHKAHTCFQKALEADPKFTTARTYMVKIRSRMMNDDEKTVVDRVKNFFKTKKAS